VKTCQQCGELFDPVNERPSHPAKYCSRACRDTAQRTRVALVCVQCGQEFHRKAYMAQWSRERGPFCGFRCYGKWQSVHCIGVGRKRITVTCHTCGKAFEKQPSAVNKTHNFCSRACLAIWRSSLDWSGENNPSWLGGHTAYRGGNWHTQGALARKRDKDTCQHCGLERKSLPVHHKIPFHLFERYQDAKQLDNLITLCPTCHSKADMEFWQAHPELLDGRRFPNFSILKFLSLDKALDASVGPGRLCSSFVFER
jgi:endogenous inhibitor of DNA gyrase (YacG/DUF329 family)